MKQQIELPPEVAMYSVKTAANATSFGERYWIERIRNSDIKVVRIGRSVRILRQDLMDFLETKLNVQEG